MGNSNRETKTIKNSSMEILKLRNVIPEIKQLGWLNQRLEKKKERDIKFEIVYH